MDLSKVLIGHLVPWEFCLLTMLKSAAGGEAVVSPLLEKETRPCSVEDIFKKVHAALPGLAQRIELQPED